MIKEDKQYLAPSVKVFEIKERKVIYQSPIVPTGSTGGEEDDLGY